MQHPIQILVVEDNFVNALILRKLLEKEFQVIVAQNGTEALAASQSHTFVVVLMDINLGNDSPDGIQVMRQMRLLPQCRNTKFFAVTSYALPEDRKRFLQAGFDDYFAKPIEKDEILPAILKWADMSTLKV
ncbi:MAG: hypothetical protein OHK0053_29890 [Microscillaceae bacterium]